jgi:bisphosphoglycerate-dependent phosphoglycerate mutase
VILIKEGIKEIKDRNNKINKYAFEINIIYQNALIGSPNKMLEKIIIDYDSKLIDIKIIKMRESFVLIDNYFSFFGAFYSN